MFPTLPFRRQAKLASQHLLRNVQNLLTQFRRTQPDPPRARIRSLDVIPLAFNLPRSTPVFQVTHTILPGSILQKWDTLSLSCSFTRALLTQILHFFTSSATSSHKRIPPFLTWNPSSLATIHHSSSSKLNHILKFSRTHICMLQETQWSSVQFNHLTLSSPFMDLTHTEAVPEFSSGVATLLPRPFYTTHHKILSPGFIFSTSTSFQGLSCEIINVYLHPQKVQELSSALLLHLQSPDSRAHSFRIIGGDFNQLDHKHPHIFQDILLELDASPPNPSYFQTT